MKEGAMLSTFADSHVSSISRRRFLLSLAIRSTGTLAFISLLVAPRVVEGAVEGAEELPVALERPSGLVVDTLLDAGHPVVPIHPNALKASRPRYSAAGGRVIRATPSSSPTCCAPTATASARSSPCPTRRAPSAPSSG